MLSLKSIISQEFKEKLVIAKNILLVPWKNTINEKMRLYMSVLQKSAFEHELATFLKQNRSRNSGQKSKQSVKKNSCLHMIFYFYSFQKRIFL